MATSDTRKAADDLRDLADASGITMTVRAPGATATITPRSGPAPRQLSLDVGGLVPDKAVVKVSGDMLMHRELEKGEEVHVQLVDSEGSMVADGYGRISALTFKDRVDADSGEIVGCDRIHTAKVS